MHCPCTQRRDHLWSLLPPQSYGHRYQHYSPIHRPYPPPYQPLYTPLYTPLYQPYTSSLNPRYSTETCTLDVIESCDSRFGADTPAAAACRVGARDRYLRSGLGRGTAEPEAYAAGFHATQALCASPW